MGKHPKSTLGLHACVPAHMPEHTLTPMRTFIYTCTDMKKIERYGDI